MPVPEIGVADRQREKTTTDEYFDRLDAAFATLTSAPPPSSVPPAEELSTRVPTVEDVLTGASLRTAAELPATARVMPPPAEPPERSATLTPQPSPRPLIRPAAATPPRGDGHSLAGAFSLLFAIERGELDPSALPPDRSHTPLEVTDELIDQITRRVLERLAPDAVRGVVGEIVSDVAERLVRDEIQRIRGQK